MDGSDHLDFGNEQAATSRPRTEAVAAYRADEGKTAANLGSRTWLDTLILLSQSVGRRVAP